MSFKNILFAKLPPVHKGLTTKLAKFPLSSIATKDVSGGGKHAGVFWPNFFIWSL